MIFLLLHTYNPVVYYIHSDNSPASKEQLSVVFVKITIEPQRIIPDTTKPEGGPMSDQDTAGSRLVNISTELYDQISERAKAIGFNTIEEYVNFVLEELLKDEDEDEQTVDAEDEEEVKKRLRSLGYIE